MARPKVTKENPKCPLCGSDMLVEYGCNFEQMTQRASWHMSFNSRMTFCGDCSKELLQFIEKWYKKRNATSKYSKFPDLDDIEI